MIVYAQRGLVAWPGRLILQFVIAELGRMDS